MKGRITKALLAAAALACGSAGCCLYRDLVDVSYPERHEYEARQSVNAALTTQAQNGHIVDQTIWNIYFDPGSDRLTPAGMRQLAALGRRRPAPDTVVYLQTANDVEIDPTNPEAMVEAREKLDSARQKATQRFLMAQTGLAFEVVLPHDPPVPSLFGQEAVSIIRDISGSARGTLTAAPGAGAGGGGGAAPAGGGAPGGGGR